MNLLERKSIRLYDENHKIPRDVFEQILKDTYRAPSSMNLQPWRLYIVETKEAKEQLKTVLYGNDLQLNTSSAMVVFFGDKDKFELADKLYSKAVDEGKMTVSVKEAQLKKIENLKVYMTEDKIKKDIYIDGGLVAMQFMQVAKSYGYDTCAIGGYNSDKINEALKIDKRYLPILIVSIGKAKEDGHHSVRLDLEDTTTWL